MREAKDHISMSTTAADFSHGANPDHTMTCKRKRGHPHILQINQKYFKRWAWLPDRISSLILSDGEDSYQELGGISLHCKIRSRNSGVNGVEHHEPGSRMKGYDQICP